MVFDRFVTKLARFVSKLRDSKHNEDDWEEERFALCLLNDERTLVDEINGGQVYVCFSKGEETKKKARKQRLELY